METLRNIMNQPDPHQIPITTLLHNMEQQMQDLVEKMGGLSLEEQHDGHIETAIWGETTRQASAAQGAISTDSAVNRLGNNTRPIATISDDHLEMLTRLSVRAASRAEARERIFTETSITLATLHDITNEPYPYQLQVVTLLHTME
ncbi:hypothetical protein PENSOL_c014G02451 [Penicillium solitum]|uniref:Uncharacterized protein n=1 Tax=Penicillium solitum TaxID=60172 RepID=A0A1V6R720_9EURO|nr:uncharacterized protein PENSOL_c014G02451 [Penicillium solitum]OQD96986.1 hypothetical protein PENSOL_c014G02451 [Penicillium solitum]